MSGAFGNFSFGQTTFGGSALAQVPLSAAIAVQTAAPTVPTTIAPLTLLQFAGRLAAAIPNGWAGSDALYSGVAQALLAAFGSNLQHNLARVIYDLSASRFVTSTAPELDLASQDFFGSGLPRPAGMSDANFAELIITSLFQSAATRPSIAAALTRLTGVAPRMLEPWSIFDCGVWDLSSYWDVDTPANPARWGSPESTWQGFIETISPSIPAIGPNNPVLGWDSVAYWDVPGYFFGVISVVPGLAVYNLVAAQKAEGTTVWVKILSSPPQGAVVLPGSPTQVILTALSSTSIQATWTATAVGTVPIEYVTQYRQTGTINWTTGPTTTQTIVTVANLQPFTSYDFRVGANNSAGTTFSQVFLVTTSKQDPSPATNLAAALVQATAVTLTWTPPASGTGPFSYNIQYRVTGTLTWSVLSVGMGTVGVTVIGLQASTSYDFEVVTSN